MKNIRSLTLLGAAVLAVSGTALAQNIQSDPVLSAYGQFAILDGQTKTLAHGKHDRHYRICVRNVRASVPLRVTHDGLETMVHPGDCADVEGMRIAISPGATLGRDMELLGSYRHLSQ